MLTASHIIDLLDGSAAVSRETGFPLTTIESWKAANFIPPWRQDAILSLARKAKKQLSSSDFPPVEARIPRPKQDAAA